MEMISEASREWRAGPMILEEKPVLGNVHAGSVGQTVEQAIDDLDNEILWYRSELARLEQFRAAIAQGNG